jgi:urea transport system substrate-binding protein
MSISETSVKDATLMAIEEINAAGGILGRQIVPTIEDGASDWPTFAEKTRKLIQQDQVAAIFG